jgi:hypothetical protein
MTERGHAGLLRASSGIGDGGRRGGVRGHTSIRGLQRLQPASLRAERLQRFPPWALLS